ncbi:MAG TPA: hypothetical protein VI729_13040 [Anaerolineales bacterium]|nr:hypothetical protein [Anaerolineales bacterium]
MPTTQLPADEPFTDPIINLTYAIDINSEPAAIWPWIVQVGYHRAGWYIDKWWDRVEQDFFWPNLVPAKDRGKWQPPAQFILPEYQGLKEGDIIPDGPPGSAYYEVIALEPERLLVLRATTHFKYIAPSFVKGTRFEPRGEFRWAFELERISVSHTRLTSRWRAWGEPRLYMVLIVKPAIWLIDHIQQPEILKGIKRRSERVDIPRNVAA